MYQLGDSIRIGNSTGSAESREGAMRIMFIDDRMYEVERLISQSGITASHDVEIHIFRSFEGCISVVNSLQPDMILIGHGLSAYPITGSDVINYLRENGITAKFIANSGGGATGFDSDGIAIDGSVERNPYKIRDLLKV